MENLAHSASFHSGEQTALSKLGIRFLEPGLKGPHLHVGFQLAIHR
jgi:hypothetical protein